MKFARIFVTLCLTATLAACSASDILLAAAGKYLFSDMTLTTNSCKADAALTLAGGTDVVTQNGQAVAITNDGTVIAGSIDEDNRGFTITYIQELDGLEVKVTFVFRVITSSSPLSLKITTTAGDCVLEYMGTASRM